MEDRITKVSELREYMGSGGDLLNIFVATECTGLDGDVERAVLAHATRLQVEGYVLQPRKLRATPVEIVTEDREDAAYIMRCIHTSIGPLAQRQAQGVNLAGQLFGFFDDRPARFAGLGESLEIARAES